MFKPQRLKGIVLHSVLLFLAFTTILAFVDTDQAASIGQSGVEVVVEGWAHQGTDLATARDEAVLDAKRRGVEMVLGNYIEARTILDNFNAIDDLIISRSTGYISQYEILGERLDGDLVVATVSMTIVEGSLKKDVMDIQGALSGGYSPTIGVGIPISPDFSYNRNSYTLIPQSSWWETSIIEALTIQGFEIRTAPIYDKFEALRLQPQDEISPVTEMKGYDIYFASSISVDFIDLVYNSDMSVIADLGNAYESAYLLVGSASGTNGTEASLMLINVDLERVIWRKSVKKCFAGLFGASGDKVDDVVDEIKQVLHNDVLSRGHTIRSTIEGIDLKSVIQLERRLKNIRFTEAVHMRSFDITDSNVGDAVFDVTTSLPTHHLAESILWWDSGLMLQSIDQKNLLFSKH